MAHKRSHSAFRQGCKCDEDRKTFDSVLIVYPKDWKTNTVAPSVYVGKISGRFYSMLKFLCLSDGKMSPSKSEHIGSQECGQECEECGQDVGQLKGYGYFDSFECPRCGGTFLQEVSFKDKIYFKDVNEVMSIEEIIDDVGDMPEAVLDTWRLLPFLLGATDITKKEYYEDNATILAMKRLEPFHGMISHSMTKSDWKAINYCENRTLFAYMDKL